VPGQPSAPILLAVPNVSDGRDHGVISRLADAFQTDGVALLDVHSDTDHNRSVYTLAGAPHNLTGALISGAREAIAAIDLGRHQGAHPRVGALDVAPIVHLTPDDRGAACTAALTLADRLGSELSVPVFLYGALTANARTRADIRRGGSDALSLRIRTGKVRPDFGPRTLHPTAGATLVAARPPLVAFNVELAPPADLNTARRIAALVREGGPEGLTGVRAIGIGLASRNHIPQVSTNIENHLATSLAAVVEAISRHATPARAELVGLAPASAFDGFPRDFELANRRTIEDALRRSASALHVTD
jgi:glutamate formiminotransferase/glutamate formiminotransferase/formiminotetrahydrofolate cyclodeaminase